jgi:hypothetical protein
VVKDIREGLSPVVLHLRSDRKAGGITAASSRGAPYFTARWMPWKTREAPPPSIDRNSLLFTTLSPCAMCSGAILLYGIPKVIIGENRTFLGEEELLRSRGVQVDVLQDPEYVSP